MSDPIVKITDLTFTYPDGTHALSGVNLSISSGESVGLVGPNGAGKSTLLMHLCGVLRTNGRRCVGLFGLNVEKKNLMEVRRRLGMVFQDPDDQLFMPTVFDDVAFGPLNLGVTPEEVARRVREALRRVQLEGVENKAPHHLSGGEKRAAAIATALSMEPELLLMDEPTSSLDPRSRRNLINLLKSFPQAKLITSHDLEMILDVCQRCVLLDRGEVVADGPTERILSDAALLEAHGLEVPMSLRRLHPGT